MASMLVVLAILALIWAALSCYERAIERSAEMKAQGRAPARGGHSMTGSAGPMLASGRTAPHA